MVNTCIELRGRGIGSEHRSGGSLFMPPAPASASAPATAIATATATAPAIAHATTR